MADHCNLKCSNCGTFSPLLPKQYSEFDSFKDDITELSRYVYADRFEFHGGEPLLHKEIGKYLELTKSLNIAREVSVLTNGKMIPKMTEQFFTNVDYIRISAYPNVNIDYREINNFLISMKKVYKFRYEFVPMTSFFIGHTEIPHKSKDISKLVYTKYCRDVYDSQCPGFSNGKLFKCNQPYFLPKYLKVIQSSEERDFSEDGIDIHADNLEKRIEEYMNSDNPLHSCDYCYGTLAMEKNYVEVQHQIVDVSALKKKLAFKK